MKKEESKILDKLGKDAGFKVPDNYFNDFNARLMESLPEVKITEEEKPTMWVRVRPFVYMAAMFAGVWLMMNIFTIGSKSTATGEQRAAQISAGVANEKNAEELINYGSVSDYDIMTYEDSVNMEMEEHDNAGN
jgi:hypothetical protein